MEKRTCAKDVGDVTQPDTDTPVGKRIKYYRERLGMPRPVLAGLVGRSPEWIKAIETGRLQTPKLPMLLRVAQALDIDDLAVLTGDGYAVPVAVFAGERHAALSAVQAALTEYHTTATGQPPNVVHLAHRLERAWQVRHSSSDHRTQLGALLPGLIRDAQIAVRTLRGDERRNARRVLSGVYQLADFYVAYQPAPELSCGWSPTVLWPRDRRLTIPTVPPVARGRWCRRFAMPVARTRRWHSPQTPSDSLSPIWTRHRRIGEAWSGRWRQRSPMSMHVVGGTVRRGHTGKSPTV